MAPEAALTESVFAYVYLPPISTPLVWAATITPQRAGTAEQVLPAGTYGVSISRACAPDNWHVTLDRQP